MNRQKIDKLLNANYKFKKLSSHKAAADFFTDEIAGFMFIVTLDSFKKYFNDYISNNTYWDDVSDAAGPIDPEKILIDPLEWERFKNYFNNGNLGAAAFTLDFLDIDKPCIVAMAKDPGDGRNLSDAPERYILIDDVKSEKDLISFLNDILTDIGDVPHETGIQYQYQIISKD